jgi:hypothetical protein
MDDALLTLLISESVNSSSASRRKAAVSLAHAIRVGGENIGASVGKLLAQVSDEESAAILVLCGLHAIPGLPFRSP